MKNNDAQLIQRVLEGDDTAFSTLVGKYQKSIHALAWRRVGDFHIAEDITQDTFLKAYRELSTLNKPQRFASWLYVIASNYCKMWFRKKRLSTQPLENISSTQLEEATYSGFVIEEKERSAEETQREVVKKLLAKLQESERTVMTLYYLGGMTHEEISEFLGVSVAAIKNRLYRARQRLRKEETMIREALEHFQISPNLTDNIMKKISRTKQVAPTSGKPFIPWIVGVTAVTIVLLLLGFSNQFLSRFQQPYNFNASSEMKVELIDTPIVQNLESDPDDRTQFGNVNAQGENNGSEQQINNAAPVDLETIITKMKHYESSATSVTGDFVMERHRGTKIEKDEYTLTYEGEKVRIEREKRDFVNLPLVEYWDGKQQWEVYRPDNLLFKVEIVTNKESTVLEKVQLAFKQVGIKITGDIHIVAGDLANSHKITDKYKTYIVLFVGDTTLEVYDHDVGYSVRPEWTIVPPDIDPRFWLTYPRLGSDNSYLSEPLWQLLEKHESKLIGSEILDGEMTTVIHLTKPARTIGDRKIPPHHLKLWISPIIGFRLVKLERKYISDDRAYIDTREIVYHEYLPNVWFPKRIETSTVPEKPPNPQQEANFIFKNVLITKQCKINTDVSRLLRLDLSTDTAIFDDKSGHQLTIDDLEVKPNFQMMLANSNVPTKNSGLKQPISDFTSQKTLKWHLPEGAKTRIGKGWIDKIEYSPDGKLLAVVSSIGIWLYDAHTGQELDLLIKHSVQVQSVAFSPDGKTLISGNSDSTIHLWDTQTHTLQNTFKGHTDSVLSVVFSSDGSSLASGSKDNTICLWDVQTGKLQKKLKGHTNTVISVVFDPKGGTLASGGKDNTLRLWDAETGTLQETIDLVEYTEIMEMAFSPDGKTLAAWDWGTIHLWDVETGVIEKTLKEQERDVVYGIAFNPDGKTIASAMGNGTIRLWHTQTWEQHRILIGHKDHVYSITFSPDGKTLTSGGFDGTLRWWDLETGECRNTRTGHNSDTIDVSYSPDGKTIASAMDNGTVGLWNAQTGMLLHTQKVLHIDSESINSVSFGPDGKTLAGGGYGRVIHLWDVETGERKTTLNEHDTVTSVAFSTDGKILASASWDSTIRLWDTETDTIRHTFEEHTDWVNSVVFSPDGNTLVSGSTDKTVNLWNTQTGELHKTLTGHTDEVTSVAFNPNGNIIASGSKDGTIHLWDAQMGEIQQTLTKHTNAVSRVAFSPDGKTLVSGSLDKTIHLWDVETGKHRNTLTGHTQWVSSVAFSPDGNTLVSGSRDGTLLLWDITPTPTN